MGDFNRNIRKSPGINAIGLRNITNSYLQREQTANRITELNSSRRGPSINPLGTEPRSTSGGFDNQPKQFLTRDMSRSGISKPLATDLHSLGNLSRSIESNKDRLPKVKNLDEPNRDNRSNAPISDTRKKINKYVEEGKREWLKDHPETPIIGSDKLIDIAADALYRAHQDDVSKRKVDSSKNAIKIREVSPSKPSDNTQLMEQFKRLQGPGQGFE